ncbi:MULTISPECIES: nuclear transport factor 2 family protein [unclassified Streptomyces]|uniref:nuclear transport factor 2 family protein n=1 Tax=unclassified Streptomyces TaxID=2593676 RepID=UPI002E1291D7|nr:nuclear transport factor 2 family protein [Streptomyces sp. NBC_01197]WSS51790.1 nuclear transport factor 2 family protein [Streptomyces sp. NBC_01180]
MSRVEHDPTSARLAATEDIKQLKARYFRLMDTKDWTAMREVFTDDARMDIDGFVTTGGDAIAAFLSDVLTDVRTVHHGHMPEIELTGDGRATGIWAMYDYVQFPGDGLPQGFHGYGHYHDEYRLQDGAWRIATTRVARLRQDLLAGGLPQGQA